MSAVQGKGRVEEITIFAVITRANGTVESSVVVGQYQAGFFGWLRRKLQVLMKGQIK